MRDAIPATDLPTGQFLSRAATPSAPGLLASLGNDHDYARPEEGALATTLIPCLPAVDVLATTITPGVPVDNSLVLALAPEISTASALEAPVDVVPPAVSPTLGKPCFSSVLIS